MKLLNLKFGDILWGSREYTGNDYGIGYNDTPLMVIKSENESVYAVVGKESIDVNEVKDFKGIKVNVLYKDYYFDIHKIDEVRFEFIYRYEQTLDEENKLIAKQILINEYKANKLEINHNKSNLTINNLDIKEVIDDIKVNVENVDIDKTIPTTIYIDAHKEEPNIVPLNPFNELNEYNVGISRKRTNIAK